MSLAREIKDLSIALQALNQFRGIEQIEYDVQKLLEAKVNQLQKEVEERNRQDDRHELDRQNEQRRSNAVDDQIPF